MTDINGYVNNIFNKAEQGDLLCNTMRYTLLKNFPPRLYGGKCKTTLKYAWANTKPTIVALKYDGWLVFNTQERISMMVFDIDVKKLSIDELYEQIRIKIKNIPAWIIETKRGYQFGYVLQNHIFTNQRKSLRYLQNIRKAIVKELHCDAGANKNRGFMRNPLASTNYIFHPEIMCELNDFNHLLPKVDYSKKKIQYSNVVYVNKKEFAIGNRHLYLLKRGVELVKKDGANNIDDVVAMLSDHQKKLDTSFELLNYIELLKVARSVYNYYKSEKIPVYVGSVQVKNTPRSKVSFYEEYGKRLSPVEYEVAVTKRRAEHAKITNKIRSKGHLKKQCKKRQSAAKTKIKKVVKYLQKQNINITQSSILKYSKSILDKGVSVNSIKNYLQQSA